MQMKTVLCGAALAAAFAVQPAHAAEERTFDAQKMLSEIEQQLELSGEALAGLKPAIDEKSAELKDKIDATVDSGFVQIEELTSQLDAATNDVVSGLREALTGEQVQQLKDYLAKIDQQAIAEVRDRLVAELEALLQLTREQVDELRPLLEDAFDRLGKMLDRLVEEGGDSLARFRADYEELMADLRRKLSEKLDSGQLRSLDAHRDELREKISEALFPGQ